MSIFLKKVFTLHIPNTKSYSIQVTRFFLSCTKLINDYLGFREQDRFVYVATDPECCEQWMADISDQWITGEKPELYYVDGNVQVYHGSLATLGKKHVNLPAAISSGYDGFWVNSLWYRTDR